MKLGTTTHPKFRRLQKLLKLPSYAVVGILELLRFMASYGQGNLPYSAEEIGDYIDFDDDSVELINCLVECKFLRKTDDGFALINLHRHDLKSKSWKFARRVVIDRDGTKCHYCGCDCSDDVTVDHVVPYCSGGTDDLSNLVVACRKCNSTKGAR